MGGVGILLTGALMWVVSLGVVRIVALNAQPLRRANMTAVASYVLVAGGFAISDAGNIWINIAAPFVALPGAFVVRWFWLNDFKRRWHDGEVPKGMRGENTDWRIGLAGVVGVLIVAACRAVFLRAAKGGL